MTGVIVHEWIEKSGGAEKVLDAMVDAFPISEIHCLWSDAPDRFPNHSVVESRLANTPFRRHKAAALPLTLATWRRLRSSNVYDWALISSHLFAHHARFLGVNRDIPKFVYAHTPARYIWVPDLDSRGSHWVTRSGSKIFKPIDKKRSREAHSFAANSEFVRKRIEATWERSAQVIYPPVDVERINSVSDWRTELDGSEMRVIDRLPKRFVLGASRFVRYKRLDLVIDVAKQLALPVVLAGQGPDMAALASYARQKGVTCIFVLYPSDQLLFSLYQLTELYVFPPIEDFGIMPVEAMAAGANVLANQFGGASETVTDGQTGALTDFRSEKLTKIAAERAIGSSSANLLDHTAKFSTERFKREIQTWVSKGIKEGGN